MATTIDWGTKVITVLRADMTLVQSSPTEIRELGINAFRLDLRALEASLEGMPYLRTHNHNTEVLLGGIVYARIIEILNGYTVTFEDGQYAVNLTGANSNIGDVINVNQVSVRSQNSAGLISNQAIEFSSFNGGVTIDVVNGALGTVFPTGTPQQPVKLQSDLHLISGRRGLNTIFVRGDITLDNVNSWIGHEFIGESALKTTITIPANASVTDCEFYDATVTGTLDGNSQIERSVVNVLDFVDGYIFNCAIGDMTLGTSVNANIFSCYSTVAGTATPEIDMNGTGTLALRDYSGGVKLLNYTGTGSHSIDLEAGQIVLDSATVTSGTFVVRGVGKLIDENGIHIHGPTWNGVTIVNELINNENIQETVWNAPTVDYQIPGSTGKALIDAGAAGNPWDVLVGTPIVGTYGYFVTKKLLTFAKWIGLR